jgi:AbiEi antitoxin C-terminal domain
MFIPTKIQDAFDPHQPFSRAEARAAGLTPEMLLSRRFHKIFWDTYVAREVPITPRLRAQAVIRLVPSGSSISHHTAAELWGAASPPDGATHVTLPSARGRQVRRGIRSHYRAQPAQTTFRKGLPISTPEQTFLDLAAVGVGLVDLVVVADGMINNRHTSPERLIEAAAQSTGRGCRLARRAASLARKGVDSPQETPLRLLLVLAGLPEPSVNLIIRARDGSWRRRYDLSYEHLRMIIEYDGRQHAEDAQQWLTDIFGREELDRMRWRLVIVTSEGIYQDPLRTLERVRDALLACGVVGIHRTFKPEWRLHFPTREQEPSRDGRRG